MPSTTPFPWSQGPAWNSRLQQSGCPATRPQKLLGVSVGEKGPRVKAAREPA